MTKSCKIKVSSPNVVECGEYIEAKYRYQTTDVTKEDGKFVVTPKETVYTFQTQKIVPKIGCMLVGWGGNNGSTVSAAMIANRLNLTWNTKSGVQKADFYGSITQCSTVALGTSADGNDVYVPLKDMLPMVDPVDVVLDGWDISSMNLADSLKRAQVLEWDLQQQLRPQMEKMVPRRAVYYPDFVAANQVSRADNILTGTKQQHVEQLRRDIRDFKQVHGLDKVIVLWTANTERYCDVRPGLNDTADNLLLSIAKNDSEISASTVYAVASILEGCCYINGSPQNTFVPGLVNLAEQRQVFIAGDDFKSGQTKLKSVLVDFLVGAGLKPTSIVSYNHLGNNDGKNLSAPEQFRSKEISKSNVVDDVVGSNPILYGSKERPDHCVVIKYVPYVGDSKRAMDEYTSEIMMGGRNTLVIHNTCEDSLLAAPIIVDLIVLAELCQRIEFRVGDAVEFQKFNSVLSVLSYLCKAPLVPKGTPVVNALFKQRACIENIFRACLGLAPLNHMMLEHKHQQLLDPEPVKHKHQQLRGPESVKLREEVFTTCA